MKNKNLFIFGVIAALALGAALFDVNKEKRDEEKKAEETQIVRLKENEISNLTIEQKHLPGGSKIVLEKTAEGWMITEPVKDQADAKVVDEFVKGILTEKSNEVAAQGTALDWKVYGLDQPKTVFTLSGAKVNPIQIAVSGKKNFQGESFLRVGNENQVWIAGSTWLAKTEKKTFDFRNKKIFRETTASIKGFHLKFDKEEVEVTLNDAEWSLKPAAGMLNLKLSQNRVRELVTLMGDLQATEVVAETHDDKVLFSKNDEWSLKSPRVNLTLMLKDNKTWNLKLAENKTHEWFGVTDSAPQVYKLDTSHAERLLKMTLDSLRDREEPFKFSKNDVKKIETKTALKQSQFKLDKEQKWVLDPADAQLIVQQDEVKMLVEKVRDLQIDYFADQPKNVQAKESLKKSGLKGLDFSKAPNALSFKDGEGKSVIDLAWQGPEKLKIDGAEKNIYWMTSSLYKDPFQVEETRLKGLVLANLIKVEEKKESNPDIKTLPQTK
jgi:hypothetical protein